MLDRLIALNKKLTRGRPRVGLSRRLLPQVHKRLAENCGR